MFDIKVFYDYHLNKPPEFFHNIAYIDIFPSDYIIGVRKVDCDGFDYVEALDIDDVRYISVFLDGRRLYSITINDGGWND